MLVYIIMPSGDYKITERTLSRARELGVEVKPSTNKRKKLDVFKNGELVAQVGAKRNLDYPSYLEMEAKGEVPRGYSAERRRLYYLRHKYDKTPNQFYSSRLLW